VYRSIFGGHEQIIEYWEFVSILDKHSKYDSSFGVYSYFLFRIEHFQACDIARLQSEGPATADLKWLVMSFLKKTCCQMQSNKITSHSCLLSGN